MYRAYFTMVIKTQGAPHLNGDQLRRLLNIGGIEYLISGMREFGFEERVLYYKIEKEQSKLDKLTKKLPPKELLKEMIELSN